MRLFTAITFEEDIKDHLWEAMEKLRLITKKGSFTFRENLHLTLNFIGETNKLDLVKQAMDQAVSNVGKKSFDLTMGGFGRFRRRDGDICWIGVEKEENLWKLQKELLVQLRYLGFALENREYRPHITLARRVKFNDGFNYDALGEKFPKLSQKIKKISLMKSEQINGKLTYTEIYNLTLY